MKFDTILFDLDGTLLDTTPLILASFQHTLDRFCPGQYREEDVLACLGEPLRDQMKRFGGEERADVMVDTYREHNISHHDQLVNAFPGVLETVRRFHQEGIRLGVVSNKQRITVEMGLALCGLASFIDAVVCHGDTEKAKPDPAPLYLALKQMNGLPERALMVGDSRYDILAAKGAGIASAGVAWAAHGSESLRPYKPDYMLEEIQDLYGILGFSRIGGNV
ncbi:pyrophosphatase PpaX [Salinithrix halophila]|uniref:Pyrophosphatase PpaX n=1 Tax=Salinithrix halophila TaxID=1485204 RepID=A0ABV8JKF1_9BACL